jgi:hypothetical protein
LPIIYYEATVAPHSVKHSEYSTLGCIPNKGYVLHYNYCWLW